MGDDPLDSVEDSTKVGVKFDPMPTVLRTGPYRFFFVSLDRGEPPHIHVRRESMVAKFWLDPISLLTEHRLK